MKRFRSAARCAWARMTALAWLNVVAAVAAVALMACSQTSPPPDPVSFQRPTRVTFVCVDANKQRSQDESLLPLANCRSGAPQQSDPVLHALVLQSSRGEVAAVDVRSWRVLDNRSDIPGKTFAPAGEVPVAIAAAPDHPRLVYVANSASRDISVLRTTAIFTVDAGRPATVQRVRLQASDSDAALEPFDMLISPDQDALLVSSRDSGVLLRVPIKRCSDGGDDCADAGLLDGDNIVTLPLAASWSKLPAAAFEDDEDAGVPTEPYRFDCDLDLPDIPDEPVALPSRDAEVGPARPSGLALDAFCEEEPCVRRLLIADARQPIVHAVDIDKLNSDSPADALLEPILTGAPTERVAVSPRVPVSVNPHDEESQPDEMGTADATQYVYAIDARDGSVLVAQDGRVRNVSANPARRADRLDLGPSVSTASVVATSIEIVTPYFDVMGDPSQWLSAVDMPTEDSAPLQCVDNNHQRRLSERLRGVFLAVGATDGTVRVFNVHDMELRECRSCTRGESPSYTSFKPGYDPLPVIRNRIRFRTYVPSDYNTPPLLAPLVTPQFLLDGSSIGVKFDGTTNDTRIPGLECLSCAGREVVAFPRDSAVSESASVGDAGVATSGASAGACDQGEGRICSLADPYVEARDWQAVYEGHVPGTLGGRGRFVPSDDADNKTGELEFVGDTPFCSAGVLGGDVLDSGDRVFITAVLPPDALRQRLDSGELTMTESELCQSLVDARETDKTPIAFGIRAAFADRLQITSELTRPRAARATWEQVLKCFGGLPLTYQVHATDSFIVSDLESAGFMHRVIAQGDSGHCVNDPSQDPRRTGRALRDAVFDNGFLAFRPKAGSFATQTVLQLLSSTSVPPLLLTAADPSGTSSWQGVMPVQLRYSPIDQHLYIVDITARGLMRVSLDPLSSSVSAADDIQ